MTKPRLAGCLLPCLLWATDAPAQDPATAQESTQAPSPQLPPFRVLLLADGPGAEQPLTGEVIGPLGEAIRNGGFRVVDRAQAQLLARRQQAVMRTWLKDKGVEGDGALALMARCEVIVRISAKVTRQRKQQGRYVIGLSGNYSIAYVDSAESLGQGEGRSNGRSMDSYGDATRMARSALLDPNDPNSLGGKVTAALKTARETERKNGARLTIALYSAQPYAELLSAVSASLETAEGVVPGSYQALSTFPTGAFADGGQGICSEVAVRCAGGTPQLQRATIQALRKLGQAIEDEQGIELRPVVLASGRRLDVILHAAPGGIALADEVQRVVQDSVANMYRRYGDVLQGKRMAVLPASIGDASNASAQMRAFRRAFAEHYDAAEKSLHESGKSDVDPLSLERTVKIQGRVYPNLAAARSRLFELEEAFHESTAGTMAVTLGEVVEASLTQVSEGKVTVQPTVRSRDRAVDFIRLEAAASNEDGSINPDSVAFYEQEGTQFMVSTRLRRFLDEFTVAVHVIDLASGVSMQGSASFHPRFTPELTKQLGS